LLRHLGIERAHVVGHSFGGSFAIQLTLDFPEVVHSLALLEPALMVGASGEAYRESLVQSEKRYHELGADTVMEGFLQARWPGYRTELDKVLPGGHAQARADAGTTLEGDIPGFLEWSFDEADARRITQPVLAVLGGDSEALSPRFGEAQRLLLTYLPHVEGVVIPGTTHFMQLQKPRDTAEALTAFWARHPISALPREGARFPEQPVLGREQRRRRAARHGDLVVDVLHVPAHRLRRDPQILSHLPIRCTPHDQP
jgi:pimeloyl-ACP methyl ester carboxylesterase